jgi:hypothetical protein
MEAGTTVFDVSFKAPAPAKGTVKALRTGLPEGSVLRNIPGVFLQERDLPLLLHHPANETVFLRFKLAEGLKPSYLPAAVKDEKACGSLDQTWNLKDGALEWDVQVTVPKAQISVKDYPDFRELAGRANAQANRVVLFE